MKNKQENNTDDYFYDVFIHTMIHATSLKAGIFKEAQMLNQIMILKSSYNLRFNFQTPLLPIIHLSFLVGINNSFLVWSIVSWMCEESNLKMLKISFLLSDYSQRLKNVWNKKSHY